MFSMHERRARKLYRQGKSISVIAETVGYSRAWVYKVCLDLMPKAISDAIAAIEAPQASGEEK